DEPRSAIADVNLLLQKKPDAARAISLRGVAHFATGNLAQAKEDLQRASAIDPKDPQLWNNLGYFAHKTGDHRSALEAINRALQLDPEYGKARDNLRLILERESIPAGSGLEPELGAADASKQEK
ncbi:MAG: tetratricopeptide repeat protein, partial [Deltaproteobacteria bacterium]|nr:tetratricopeptide repeat protein [Deltaproteobacteria bacterium]